MIIISKKNLSKLITGNLQINVFIFFYYFFFINFSLNTKIENNDGSAYELRMQYTSLPQIELEKLNKEIQPFENSKLRFRNPTTDNLQPDGWCNC
jgi:hypothetical protein